MLRKILIVLCLLTCLVGAKVPAVGDVAEIVFNPGLEFTRYVGVITDVTDSGIGIKPSLAYRQDPDGFIYIFHYNNTTNEASAFVMNNAIAYVVMGVPVIESKTKTPSVLRSQLSS